MPNQVDVKEPKKSATGKGVEMPGGGGMDEGGDGGNGGGAPLSRGRCGAMHVHDRLLREHPGYAEALDKHEIMARAYTRGDLTTARSGVTKIPVVVHVVYNTAAENITEAQIKSQIDVLNKDFRKKNPDVSKVPTVWSSVVADARVEFFMATVDPNGQPTKGITRTKTATTSFSHDDKVKSSSTGGQNPWAADRYLNLWVCNLGGGLLGYAQFPGGPSATDGVVINYTAFGTNGTAADPFNLGRTATHEVGHWLNLRHIWGDDGTGCSGSDEVADTPNQGGPNTNTPTFPHVSCSNGPNGDMFVNYMDYVDDSAMFMFTAGQVARIDACLDGPRASFKAAQPTAVTVNGNPANAVVAWGDNRLDVFALDAKSAMVHKWWNGASWGPSLTGAWENLGGVCLTAPKAISWGSNRLDVFTLGTNSAIYHKWWDGSHWGPSMTSWENLGGIGLSTPTAVAWGANRLDVFVIGTDSAAYHKWWDGSKWGPSMTDWEKLGGTCLSPVEPVAWGANRLDLFVLGTDQAVYHKWWDGKNWGPSVTNWESLGGVCTSRPVAVAWGANRLDVFVTGTDSALYHKAWNGNSWQPSLTGWERLGGVCMSEPAVVSWGANRLDVFVVGTNAAVHHMSWNGTVWSGWENLGGIWPGEIRAECWGANRIDLFLKGTDGVVYHKWWNGSAWGPSKTNWESMGGTIIKI